MMFDVARRRSYILHQTSYISHLFPRQVSCIYAPRVLQVLHSRRADWNIAYRQGSDYDAGALSSKGFDFVFLLVARDSPSELGLSSRSCVGSLASLRAIKLFDLKSALLMALVASALLAPMLVPARKSWLLKLTSSSSFCG